MLLDTDKLEYDLERYHKTLRGPARERTRLGYQWRLSEARDAIVRAINAMWASYGRWTELCFKLDPACEMNFA